MSPAEEAGFTYEDYLALPDDGNRYEIIEDRLSIGPSPTSVHQILSRRLQFELYRLEQAGHGFIFDAPMDLEMEGPRRPARPDVLCGRAAPADQAQIPGGPAASDRRDPIALDGLPGPGHEASQLRPQRRAPLLDARPRIGHYGDASPGRRRLPGGHATWGTMARGSSDGFIRRMD